MIPFLVRLFLSVCLFRGIHGISNDDSSLSSNVLNEIKFLKERIEYFENVNSGQNKLIANLQHAVSEQNVRIKYLELTVSGENNQRTELERTVTTQRNLIADLKHNVSVQSSRLVLIEDGMVKQNQTLNKFESKEEGQPNVVRGLTEQQEAGGFRPEDNRRIKKHSSIRKERLLNIPGQPPSTEDGLVAFYAILSAPEQSPSVHHTIVFDVVKTNVGNGYNHFTGAFTAPRDGVYVFIWVVRMATAEHSTELIIDSDVYGATFLRAKGGDDGSVSGTVVAVVSKGQSVFVRIHSSYAGDGAIHSNLHGQPSFSGWLLR